MSTDRRYAPGWDSKFQVRTQKLTVGSGTAPEKGILEITHRQTTRQSGRSSGWEPSFRSAHAKLS